jgi:hypothetical protein
MFKIILIVMPLILLVGCVPPAAVKMKTDIVESDYEKFRLEGKNTVSGQAFLRQKGGAVVTCAGSQVRLSPNTEYFREYWNIVKATKQKAIEPEYSGKRISRDTFCDAQGNFEFSNIPSGSYILVSWVSWQVGYAKQGGLLYAIIEVQGDKETKVILSDKDRFM